MSIKKKESQKLLLEIDHENIFGGIYIVRAYGPLCQTGPELVTHYPTSETIRRVIEVYRENAKTRGLFFSTLTTDNARIELNRESKHLSDIADSNNN